MTTLTEVLAEYGGTISRRFHDRESTIGASEIGQCARKIFFAKRTGTTANNGGAALRGQLFEQYFWTPALDAHFGDKLLFAGDDQRTLTSGPLSATPDGLLIDQPHDALAALGVPDIGGDGSIVVEGKSIDPRSKLDEPKPEHSFQVIVQLGLIRELTEWQPEWAVLSYVNASFFDDVTEFPIHFDQEVFDNAKNRAAKILAATSADEIRPEGWVAGGKECEYCSSARTCGVIRHGVPTQPPPEPVDPQFVAEITDLALEAKARRVLMEAATEDLREIEHDIKNRLRAKGVRHITGDNIEVTWSSVKGRPSHDWAGIREAAAKAGLDLSEFETAGDPTDRLTIRTMGMKGLSKEGNGK